MKKNEVMEQAKAMQEAVKERLKTHPFLVGRETLILDTEGRFRGSYEDTGRLCEALTGEKNVSYEEMHLLSRVYMEQEGKILFLQKRAKEMTEADTDTEEGARDFLNALMCFFAAL